MADELVQFYRLVDVTAARAALAHERDRTPAHRASFWHPSLSRPFAPGAFDPKLASYTLMHLSGLFDSGNYGAVLLRDKDGAVDHRSMIMPRFARFPFMGNEDLQIGATFTRPGARGMGLALRAILEIIDRYGNAGRQFWYLTDAANTASVAVIRKAGFELAGTGGKRPRYGWRFLGFYDMARPADTPRHPDLSKADDQP